MPSPLRSSLLPSASGVAALPRKAPKKAAREASSVVCVVTYEDRDGPQFLMSKRPPTGLLANMWEFPTLETSEAESEKEDRDLQKSVLQFLDGQHRLHRPSSSESTSLEHRFASVSSVGQVVHKFSHIHQTYLVAHVAVEVVESNNNNNNSRKSATPPSAGLPLFAVSDPRRKWMKEDELLACGISTAMKKVFQCYLDSKKQKTEKGNKKKREGKKNGHDECAKRQKTITTFFQRGSSKQ